MTRPTLRVPKDKARYAEAAQLQQQIAGLLHPMEASDRQMEAKTQWKPLLIQTAAANEVLGPGTDASGNGARAGGTAKRHQSSPEEKSKRN